MKLVKAGGETGHSTTQEPEVGEYLIPLDTGDQSRNSVIQERDYHPWNLPL